MESGNTICRENKSYMEKVDLVKLVFGRSGGELSQKISNNKAIKISSVVGIWNRYNILENDRKNNGLR